MTNDENFTFVGELDPASPVCSVRVKILEITMTAEKIQENQPPLRVVEALVGDSTGDIMLIASVRLPENETLPNNLELLQEGNLIHVKDAKLYAFMGSARLLVDSGSKIFVPH